MSNNRFIENNIIIIGISNNNDNSIIQWLYNKIIRVLNGRQWKYLGIIGIESIIQEGI